MIGRWALILPFIGCLAFSAHAQSYAPVIVPIPGSTIVPNLACDDVTDDAPAINAAAALAGRSAQNINYGVLVSTNYISLPPGKLCMVKETITLPTGVGFDSNGSTLDCDQPASTPCMDIKGVGSNADNTAPLRNINLSSNLTGGRTRNGLLMERPNSSVHDLTAGNFNWALSFGSNTYVDAFYGVRLFNSNYGIYYPGSVSNSGEEMSFFGGALANNSWHVYASGGEWQFYGMSFDAINPHIPVAGSYGKGYGAFYGSAAGFNLHGGHVEQFADVPVFQQEGGPGQNCSAYSIINVSDTRILNTGGTPSLPVIDLNGGTSCGGAGPTAMFSDVFLSGFGNAAATPPVPWVTGNYAGNIKFCSVTNGNLGYIIGAGDC